MEEFKEQVKKGFSACKEDIFELKNEISFLKKENLELKEQIKNLNENIIEIKGELKGIKLAFDYIKNTQQNNPNEKNLLKIKTDEKTKILKTNTKNETKDPYEALLAFKAKTNKRELLKQKMISLIGENGLSLSELKFMIVEHFKYCSKASFYNYLKELEIENSIIIRRENTKNIVYINTIKNEN